MSSVIILKQYCRIILIRRGQYLLVCADVFSRVPGLLHYNSRHFITCLREGHKFLGNGTPTMMIPQFTDCVYPHSTQVVQILVIILYYTGGIARPPDFLTFLLNHWSYSCSTPCFPHLSPLPLVVQLLYPLISSPFSSTIGCTVARPPDFLTFLLNHWSYSCSTP